jgi:hypothetical protein
MKRVVRVLGFIIRLAAVAVLVLLTLQWIRSYWVEDVYRGWWGERTVRIVQVHVCDGRWMLQTHTRNYGLFGGGGYGGNNAENWGFSHEVIAEWGWLSYGIESELRLSLKNETKTFDYQRSTGRVGRGGGRGGGGGGGYGGGGAPGSLVIVVGPIWIICAVVGVLGMSLFGIRVIGRRRRRSGICFKCGYDLRATPDPTGPTFQRCPECGTSLP